jgi:RNA polymerase sigma factor (sigma-70 family)
MRNFDSLDQFQTETHRVLSVEDERELFEEIQEGSEDAKNELFDCNVRLVGYVIKSYYPNNNITFNDILTAGYIGLWSAVVEFDPDKGKFSTIGVNKIRENIRKLSREDEKRKHFMNVDNDTIEYYQMLETEYIDPYDEMFAKEYDLNSALNNLDADERDVFLSKNKETVREIASRKNKDTKQIERIWNRAITKMLHPSVSGLLPEFYKWDCPQSNAVCHNNYSSH